MIQWMYIKWQTLLYIMTVHVHADKAHVQIKFYANCTKAFISANVLCLSFLASSHIFFLHCFSSSVSCFLFSLLPIILNEISNSNKNNVHRFKLLPVHHEYWHEKKAAALTRSNTWCHSSFLFACQHSW